MNAEERANVEAKIAKFRQEHPDWAFSLDGILEPLLGYTKDMRDLLYNKKGK